MAYTLGIDLGSNSIGWAMVDEAAQRIIRSGSRVFPEGVDRDKQGGEVGKNENRRTKRGMRRQILRRSQRKRALRMALVHAGLLPPSVPETASLDQCDPYALRARGLDEKLDLFEFGRVLIHLNQRRGFKSNRKGAKTSEERGMLAEISELAKQIDNARCRTLGEYLNLLRSEGGNSIRIRGKHTRRDMLQREFELLWSKQREYYPQVLTEQLRTELWDNLIAYQRAMYWPRSTVGRCELEPRERRCRREHRVAQRFRMFQEVNNLRVIDGNGELRALGSEERAKLIAYLSTSRERTFDDIRRHLGLLDSHGFNLEFGDRRKLMGLPTDLLLSNKKLFGKQWQDTPEDMKNRIVDVLLNDEIPDEKFFQIAREQWGVDADLAAKLAAVDLKEGYASYSQKAIVKLLPFLEKGLPLSGKPGEPDALHFAGYLRPDERAIGQRDFLPQPPEITNPLVRAALFQVRQLLNAIIREYGRPTAIHIELAREVKGTAEQRMQQAWRMRQREQKRGAVAATIESLINIRPRRKDIERYILWEQQGKVCMYSGQPISSVQLFSGDVDVDHILPYSRSLDDSQLNKVVAFRAENQAKGNQTPYEWLAERDPQKYEGVLQRAAKLPLDVRNAKRPKFAVKSVQLEEFVERQLNDTKYISRTVAQYVRCLGADVVCTKGLCTAELRHCWGLDSVLRDDGLSLKNREDHRHHAVDAITIALTNRSRLQALARARGEGELPLPWAEFRAAVEESVNAINVSIRVQRRVSGALHEETLYGATAKAWKGGAELPRDADGMVKERPWAAGWVEQRGVFTCRKPLESLTPAMVAEIRDAKIRELVETRLAAHGIDLARSSGIPTAVWREPLRMPGANGAVVKKVRLLKMDETIVPIRSGYACVKTGSNHHVCIFEYQDRGKKKREAVWVSMMEAARRVRERQQLIRREHPTRNDAVFVMSLSRGEMVWGTFKGRERLCVFQTGASTQGQLYFAAHTDARRSGDKAKFAVKANTLVARKVTVDPLGRIRWAHD